MNEERLNPKKHATSFGSKNIQANLKFKNVNFESYNLPRSKSS